MAIYKAKIIISPVYIPLLKLYGHFGQLRQIKIGVQTNDLQWSDDFSKAIKSNEHKKNVEKIKTDFDDIIQKGFSLELLCTTIPAFALLDIDYFIKKSNLDNLYFDLNRKKNDMTLNNLYNVLCVADWKQKKMNKN